MLRCFKIYPQLSRVIIALAALLLLCIFSYIIAINAAQSLYWMAVLGVPFSACILYLIYHVGYMLHCAVTGRLGNNYFLSILLILCLYPISPIIYAIREWKIMQGKSK